MRSQLKNEKGNFILPLQDLNHGPLTPKASVLPMSFADPFSWTEPWRMYANLAILATRTNQLSGHLAL